MFTKWLDFELSVEEWDNDNRHLLSSGTRQTGGSNDRNSTEGDPFLRLRGSFTITLISLFWLTTTTTTTTIKTSRIVSCHLLLLLSSSFGSSFWANKWMGYSRWSHRLLLFVAPPSWLAGSRHGLFTAHYASLENWIMQ